MSGRVQPSSTATSEWTFWTLKAAMPPVLERRRAGAQRVHGAQQPSGDLWTDESRTQVGRRSFARATAPHTGQPTTSAVVWTSISSSPPASATARISNPANPNRAAVTDVVSSFIPGALRGRVRLVVIANREGPGTYLSSLPSPGVSAPRAHVPGSMRRAGLSGRGGVGGAGGGRPLPVHLIGSSMGVWSVGEARRPVHRPVSVTGRNCPRGPSSASTTRSGTTLLAYFTLSGKWARYR
jgi:hypothetical protein